MTQQPFRRAKKVGRGDRKHVQAQAADPETCWWETRRKTDTSGKTSPTDAASGASTPVTTAKPGKLDEEQQEQQKQQQKQQQSRGSSEWKLFFRQSVHDDWTSAAEHEGSCPVCRLPHWPFCQSDSPSPPDDDHDSVLPLDRSLSNLNIGASEYVPAPATSARISFLSECWKPNRPQFLPPTPVEPSSGVWQDSSPSDDEAMQASPDEILHDSHAHTLKKTTTDALGGDYAICGFSCDICGTEGGRGWVYHCDECDFDAHPECARAMPTAEATQDAAEPFEPSAPSQGLACSDRCKQCKLKAEWIDGDLTRDDSDGAWYCARCWYDYYGTAPAQPDAPVLIGADLERVPSPGQTWGAVSDAFNAPYASANDRDNLHYMALSW